MKDIFRKSILCLQEEGFTGLIKGIWNWIPQYISWKRIIIRGWLYSHSMYFLYKGMKERGEVDSFTKFKQIRGGMEYSQRHGQTCYILNSGEKIEVVLPKSFEGRENIEKSIFDAPPIYLAEFRNVDAYGESDFFSIGDIGFSDMFCKDRGENRYDLRSGSIILHQARGKYLGIAYKKTDMIIKEAINLLGAANYNYYHFTFEIISRLVFVDEYEEYRSIPILIDNVALHIPQMKELLDKINIYHHPVISIKRRQCVHVDKMIYISKNMWIPFNFKPGSIFRTEDFMISRSAFDNIRKRVLPVQRNCENIVKKRIFLPRPENKSQRLANQEEIMKIFANNGFHIVYPEKLHFDEQVMLFNEADIIVGVGGGALTNIVYCHEKAQIVEIALETSPIYAFSAIANAIQADFIILGADVVAKGKYIGADTWVLNKDKCRRFINSLGE
ncbi:MAG: glycosyltransferase family 61 protein [Clostridium sp.]|nr:glycosyltransferase family 61 protein [Clostridium sp.]